VLGAQLQGALAGGVGLRLCRLAALPGIASSPYAMSAPSYKRVAHPGPLTRP
jgi:hypothetical protein